MPCVCKAAQPLVAAFSVAFTRPTFQRVVILILGAILTPRRRTVTAILQTVGSLAPRSLERLSPRALAPRLAQPGAGADAGGARAGVDPGGSAGDLPGGR